MGTLGDEGLFELLNSPSIEYLVTLNVSHNFITTDFIINILPALNFNCKLILDRQECCDFIPQLERYCGVRE
jgi:hypothetical protein